MDIKVQSRLTNKQSKNQEIQNLPNFDVRKTVEDLKKEIISFFELKISVDRLGLSYLIEQGCEERFPMSELKRSIFEFDNFTQKSVVVLTDLGPQINYRLVYNLEYLGPILIMTYFYLDLYTEADYVTSGQHALYYLTLFHFVRRFLESNFVHIFSRRTMPLKNLFKNCFYYWFLFAFLCGYFILTPGYKEFIKSKNLRIFLIIFYLNTEFKNLRCHMILRDLKIINDGEKGIPWGEGFNLVTCANYNWEFLGWIMLCLITTHWTIVLFTVCGFFQMKQWALKKHAYLKKNFKNYPKERTAFIPFVV